MAIISGALEIDIVGTKTFNAEAAPIGSPADLTITKDGSPNPVIAGDILAYLLEVTNNGPSDAHGVVLTDAIPVGILNSEFSTDGGLTWQPWASPYTIGTVVNGESINVLISGTVSPAVTGSITNTAIVGAATPDPDLSNNSNIYTTQVVGG